MQRYLPVVTVVVGVALACLGAWMLTGRQLSLTLPKLSRGAPTAQLSSMFGYGLAYAIASLSCTIGPFPIIEAASAIQQTLAGWVDTVGALPLLAVLGALLLSAGLLGRRFVARRVRSLRRRWRLPG